MKILYINSPKYDYVNAALIEGLKKFNNVEIRFTTAGNWAPQKKVLYRWEAVEYGKKCDAVILGSNKYVDDELYRRINNHPLKIFIDGGDASYLNTSYKNLLMTDVIFKRELFEHKTGLAFLSDRYHSHRLFKYHGWHSNKRRKYSKLIIENILFGRKKLYPFPCAIEDRFLRPYETPRTFLVSNTLMPNTAFRKKLLNNPEIPRSDFITGHSRLISPDGSMPSDETWQNLIMGKDEIIDNSDFYDHLNKSFASIIAPGGGFDSLRMWESLASGCLILSPTISQLMDKKFIAGKHYIRINEHTNFKALKTDLKAKKEYYETIRQNGHEHAMKWHTTKARAQFFLEKIKAAI